MKKRLIAVMIITTISTLGLCGCEQKYQKHKPYTGYENHGSKIGLLPEQVDSLTTIKLKQAYDICNDLYKAAPMTDRYELKIEELALKNPDGLHKDTLKSLSDSKISTTEERKEHEKVAMAYYNYQFDSERVRKDKVVAEFTQEFVDTLTELGKIQEKKYDKKYNDKLTNKQYLDLKLIDAQRMCWDKQGKVLDKMKEKLMSK